MSPFWRGFLDGLTGGPLRRWLARITWLGALNFLVLQWFGVRLARCYETRQKNVRPMRAAWLPDGSLSWAYDCEIERVFVGYRWFYWIWPLTGWWSDFRWVAKRSRWIVRRKS